jgi:PKD domain
VAAHGWQTDSSHSHGWRWAATATGLALGALVLVLTLGVPPAGAIIARIHGHGYGITPIKGVDPTSISGAFHAQHSSQGSHAGARNFDELPRGGGPLVYEGGPVMHSNTTHVIYWDPNSEFTATTKGVVRKFFTDVAHDSGLASNVFGLAGQYTDATGSAAYNSTTAAELVDAGAYPSSGCTVPSGSGVDSGPPYTECLTDEQLKTELSSYISAHSLPTGSTQLYFLLLPHKVATCLPEEEVEVKPKVFVKVHPCSNNFYCAYHSYINPGTVSEIIYSDIPFSLLDTSFAKGCQSDGYSESEVQLPNGDKGVSNAETRFADVAIKYISHEYIEAVTDPLVNSKTAWVDKEGLEIGDKCNSIPFTPGEEGEPGFDKHAFTPTLGGSAGSGTLFNQSINADHYYLQSEWDNAGKACLMKPLAITAVGFTPVAESTTVGSVVSFEAKATDPYGHTVFAWGFGDGETGNGPSPGHEYKARGKYTVTMTPTDELTGSTAAPIQHTVTVKSTQTISFTSTAPGVATVGSSTYTATATATSGLAVSFSSGTPSVCSVLGSTASFIAGGTCTIDAEQVGNEEFVAAPEVQQSFAVAPAPTHTVPSEFEVASSKEALVPPAPTPSGTVVLLGTRISIGASGAGSVRLSCTGTGACSGRLTLTLKGKHKRTRALTLGSASFSIAPGTNGTIALKLNAAGRSRLRAGHGHLSAALIIVKSSPAPAITQTRNVQVRQKLKK